MRKTVSISLAILLIILSAKDIVTWTSFKINQQTIANEWCMNSLKPELDCAGKCFLIQLLSESKDHQSNPVLQWERPAEFNYILNSATLPQLSFSPSFGQSNFIQPVDSSILLVDDTFHPPNLA